MRNRDEIKMMAEHEKYFPIVMSEYMKCTDEEVYQWFDLDSDKMLKKKAEVLKAINNGEDVDSDEFYSILELYPRDENGEIVRQN